MGIDIAPPLQSREAVLLKATETMFEKWGTYIKGEVQVRVRTCCPGKTCAINVELTPSFPCAGQRGRSHPPGKFAHGDGGQV